MTSVLCIREPWLGRILTGEKTMEVRGQSTRKRGRIYLIASGTNEIVGEADITHCEGPMSNEEWAATYRLHRVAQDARPYPKTYGWRLENARRLEAPLSFVRPRGAIIWSTYHPSLNV